MATSDASSGGGTGAGRTYFRRFDQLPVQRRICGIEGPSVDISIARDGMSTKSPVNVEQVFMYHPAVCVGIGRTWPPTPELRSMEKNRRSLTPLFLDRGTFQPCRDIVVHT
ncbi:hypothetical protein FA13DRAFT_1717857 [Coprinellus micaceus]|uniref:Uncharacterized protein n=1 Tax=Coprinellus micaceus TaxID=71717 RepID=A0A4Y7SEZ5_COPMI|nr:hypothetical protein FA13DRAFT_1717857 [Coprinellus micaceus]